MGHWNQFVWRILFSEVNNLFESASNCGIDSVYWWLREDSCDIGEVEFWLGWDLSSEDSSQWWGLGGVSKCFKLENFALWKRKKKTNECPDVGLVEHYKMVK
jgi:hypothetical protein